MKEVGLTPPPATTKTFVVMGKTFDPAKPEEYLKSFAIKRRRERASMIGTPEGGRECDLARAATAPGDSPMAPPDR